MIADEILGEDENKDPRTDTVQQNVHRFRRVHRATAPVCIQPVSVDSMLLALCFSVENQFLDEEELKKPGKPVRPDGISSGSFTKRCPGGGKARTGKIFGQQSQARQ